MPKIKLVAKALSKEAISKILGGKVDVFAVAKRVAKGQTPTLEEAAALLSTIPALKPVGDAVLIGTHAYSIFRKVTAKDDGKPKSCWTRWEA